MVDHHTNQIPTEQVPVIFPILVACFTQEQFLLFLRNHYIPSDKAVRIRDTKDAAGRRRDRPIHLLPRSVEGTAMGTIPSLKLHGWETVKVTEEQVIKGTFFNGKIPTGENHPVLVDASIHRFGRMLMCHMMSKDLDALHAMAEKLGIKRKWFQNKPGGTPHYDICKSKRALALSYGAIETDRNGIVEVIRHFRNANSQKFEPTKK